MEQDHYLAYLFITAQVAFILFMSTLLYFTRKRILVVTNPSEMNPKYEAIKRNVFQRLGRQLDRIDILAKEIIKTQLTYVNSRSNKEAEESIQLQDENSRFSTDPEQELAKMLESTLQSDNPKWNPMDGATSQMSNQVVRVRNDDEETLRAYRARATRVFLKSHLVKNPYDIRGNRRCYFAERILTAVEKREPIPQLRPSSRFAFCSKSIGLMYTKTIGYVLFVSFGLWAYDIYTDTQIGVIFLKLMCELDVKARFCPTSVRKWMFEGECTLMGHYSSNASANGSASNQTQYNGTSALKDSDATYLVSVLGIHNTNFFIFFVVSLVLSLANNPPQKLLIQLQTKLSMSLRVNEDSGVYVTPEYALKRFKISIDEAGFESLLCMGLAIGNYLNLIYAMNQMEEIRDEELSNILKTETVLLSFFISIASLTFAQMKSHDTQHEYNLSSLQRALYLMACTANTISLSLCFTSYYSICMFWCCNMYFLHPSDDPRHILGFFMNGVVCVMFIGIIRVLVSGINTVIFKNVIKRLKKFDNRSKISRFDKIFNAAEVFQLPTSNTHITSYNSIYSVHLLLKFARQCIAYILASGQLLVQFTVIWLYNGFDLNKSQEWIFYFKVVLIGIPGGYFLSYLFLWLYFKLDHGYFTSVSINYVYEAREGEDETDLEERQTFLEGSKNYLQTLSMENSEECEICGRNLRMDLICTECNVCGLRKTVDVAGHWKETALN